MNKSYWSWTNSPSLWSKSGLGPPKYTNATKLLGLLSTLTRQILVMLRVLFFSFLFFFAWITIAQVSSSMHWKLKCKFTYMIDEWMWTTLLTCEIHSAFEWLRLAVLCYITNIVFWWIQFGCYAYHV